MRNVDWMRFVKAYDEELYKLAVDHGLFEEEYAIDFVSWVRQRFVASRDDDVLYRKTIVQMYERDIGRARPKIIIPMFRELTGASDITTHQGRGFKGWAVRS